MFIASMDLAAALNKFASPGTVKNSNESSPVARKL
jgi:hypothetical protein